MNALQGLPTPCSLWVNRGNPSRGRNLSAGSVSSRSKVSGERSLDLPPEKDIEPVDYVLYDLVEGVA